jgi:hypothetical protein
MTQVIDAQLFEELGLSVKAELDRRDTRLRAEFDAKLDALAAGDGDMAKVAAAGDGAVLKWGGVWASSTLYPASRVVCCNDALWLSTRESTGIRPGRGGGAWKLILKSPSRPPRAEPEE